jgi:hypothetical protein
VNLKSRHGTQPRQSACQPDCVRSPVESCRRSWEEQRSFYSLLFLRSFYSLLFGRPGRPRGGSKASLSNRSWFFRCMHRPISSSSPESGLSRPSRPGTMVVVFIDKFNLILPHFISRRAVTSLTTLLLKSFLKLLLFQGTFNESSMIFHLENMKQYKII